MKRRTFIQSLAAVMTLPSAGALPLRSATAALPTAAAAVPTKARFWAIYMSSLHGECTPQTLHNLLHIPKVDAKRYVSQLIADGVIKPNPLLQRTATELVKGKNENLIEKVKKRSEMKAKAKAEKLEVCEAVEAETSVEEVEYSEEFCEGALDTSIEDQLVEVESQENENLDIEIVEDETEQVPETDTTAHSV